MSIETIMKRDCNESKPLTGKTFRKQKPIDSILQCSENCCGHL